MAVNLLPSKAIFKPATVAQKRVVPPPARPSVVVRSTGWADSAATTAEKAMFGENFGARDPFAAEIESNFSDKVLGNYNTDHIIKIPDNMPIGLTARTCLPADQVTALEEKQVNLLKQQVPGWKIFQASGSSHQVLRYEWRTRNPDTAAQLQEKIQGVAQAEGHGPTITVQGEMVIAELFTASVSALTENDFIVAAKINELNVKELLPPPRKKFWA